MQIQDISFSFSYFLKGWCHSFIFCATTHSIISWLHPCLPVFLLPATCSGVPKHSFLLSHSPNPLDLNTFYAYFSFLINKWLQRTARWHEWECGFRNRAVGHRGHLWSNKLNMKPWSKREMKAEWFRKRQESKKQKVKIKKQVQFWGQRMILYVVWSMKCYKFQLVKIELTLHWTLGGPG